MKTKRLAVLKTYKLFIGGAFPRSESGRVLPATGPAGEPLGNYAHASRKDFRDAVVKARAAQGKWAGSSAYLRGQILYRAAEILETRRAELEAELRRATGKSGEAEVTEAIDLLVHYAGWTDKFGALFSSVNPVASAHFNFTFPEPTGVVVAVAPDVPPLLGLIGVIAPALVAGNAVIALASERHPLPAVALAEILATSDLPGGVVNILTGRRAELAPQFAEHMDVNAVVDGAGETATAKILQAGAALNLKRVTTMAPAGGDWSQGNPYWILDTAEFKTAWHPVGV